MEELYLEKERFRQKSCVGVDTSKTFIKFANYTKKPSAETETGRIEVNIKIHIELCICANDLFVE